jgi:hypothetical protein
MLWLPVGSEVDIFMVKFFGLVDAPRFRRFWRKSTILFSLNLASLGGFFYGGGKK